MITTSTLETQPKWAEIKAFIKDSKDSIIGGVAIVALQKTIEILESHWREVVRLKLKSWPVLHLRPSDVPDWGLPHALEIEEKNIVVLSKESIEAKSIKLAVLLNKLTPVIRKTIRYEQTNILTAKYVQQMAIREAGLHYTLFDKPEIVHFYHSCEYAAKLKSSPKIIRKMVITLEYCNEKDLFKVDRELLNKQNILDLVRNMCQILNRLSLEKLLHRDIRPENLLIINESGKLTMKLGDFGFAGKIEDERRRLQREEELIGGTVDYTSPEINFAFNQPRSAEVIELMCSQKSDVWSMGIVLYEMIMEDLPSFAGKIVFDREEIKNNNSQKTVDDALGHLMNVDNCLKVLQIHDQIREFLYRMIRQMLVVDLKKRISGPDLLNQFREFEKHLL